MVGRSAEVGRLAAVLQALEAGQGTVVEITGEPGIGKTSLLCLLAAKAEAAGARVIRAQAVRGVGASCQVLDCLQVRPHVADSYVGLEPDVLARSRLQDWAAERGCVLVLDGLHLCDEQHATLVAQLVRTPVPGPFVLALAHRPRQCDARLAEILEHGVQTGGVVRLAPAPLGVDEVTALLDHWSTEPGATSPNAPRPSRTTGNPRPSAFKGSLDRDAYAEQLHGASGGNPRILRILAAAGWDPDEWPLGVGPDRDGLLREAASITAELGALTPDAAVAGAVAAVLGDPFLPDDVAAVSQLGLERTLEALAELSRADLIRPLPWGGRYAFRHPVVGRVTLEHAPPSVRLPAHQRALRLLTSRCAPVAERARQAENLARAGGSLALEALIDGAAEMVVQIPAVAARWLGLALDCMPDEQPMSVSRATVALDRCRALTAAGRLEEARTLAHEVLQHRSHLPEELRLRAHTICGDVERLLGRYREAEAVLNTALELLPRPLPVPLPASSADLITTHGLVKLLLGRFGEARGLVHEAVLAAKDSTPTLRVLAALGDTQLGLLDRSVPEVTECARLIDSLPDADTAAMPETLAMLGSAEMYLERFTDAYRHIDRGLRATSGGKQKHVLISQLVGLSTLDQWTGRLDDAVRRAQHAELLAGTLGADEAAAVARTLRVTALAWTRGRKNNAGSALATTAIGAHRNFRERGCWTSSAVALHAQAQYLGGDPAGCIRTLLDGGGGEDLPHLPQPIRPALLGLLSTAALRCGDAAAAHRWARQAEETAEQLGLPVQTQYAARARAVLHAAAEEQHRATELFRTASETFRRAGMPLQHAVTLVSGARSAQAAEGTDEALAWLKAAVEVAHACGAVRIREDAAKARARLLADGKAIRAIPQHAPSGSEALALLTNREREVALLAVSGQRSKEIAEKLFLGTRTVESHLSRIYRKLDVSSRAGLIRALSSASGVMDGPGRAGPPPPGSRPRTAAV